MTLPARCRSLLTGLLTSLLTLATPAMPVHAEATALTTAQARQAAQAILEALQRRNGTRLYSLLADPIRQATNATLVQSRLNQLKPFEASFVSGVIPGLDDTTVETRLATASGSVPLTLVLDGQGKLLAWELDNPSSPIAQRAEAFVRDVAANRLVSARSMLVLGLQQELSPQQIASRWNALQQMAGTYEGIRGSLVASSGGDQQLVLVTIQFSRLTDNLFVIFDRDGHIVGVDFPRPTP